MPHYTVERVVYLTFYVEADSEEAAIEATFNMNPDEIANQDGDEVVTLDPSFEDEDNEEEPVKPVLHSV